MAGAAGWTLPRLTAELDYVLEKLALARTGRALLADGSLPRRTQAPEVALAGAG